MANYPRKGRGQVTWWTIKLWWASTISLQYLLKRSSTYLFPGWLLIFLLLTPLRLNSCSSDSKNNLSEYTTLHSTPPTLLETLASSLTNILLSLTKLPLSKACYYRIRQLFVPLLPLSSTPNLITVILCTIYKLSKGVFDYRIRIRIHIEYLWQADLTFIRKY